MRKFFDSGNAFFLLAILFILISLFAERSAVYISLGALWFILGLAVRKKNAQKSQPRDESKQ